MTAFGRAGCELVDWEIRSVNHRYLELGFRLPEPFRDLERSLREMTVRRIRRGKVDATLRLASQTAIVPRLNGTALNNVLAAVRDLREQVEDIGNLDPLELLGWPGVLEEDERNLSRFKEAAMLRYGEALGEFLDHRLREGATIDALLRERLEGVERTARVVRELAAEQGAALRERLQRRVQELISRLDGERLEQEVALLAQRADVTEELDRLDTHVAEAQRCLDAGEPCGRRLDFLMQEMGREANTLAAKSVLPEAARLAVDLKVVISEMREQVQNVE